MKRSPQSKASQVHTRPGKPNSLALILFPAVLFFSACYFDTGSTTFIPKKNSGSMTLMSFPLNEGASPSLSDSTTLLTANYTQDDFGWASPNRVSVNTDSSPCLGFSISEYSSTSVESPAYTYASSYMAVYPAASGSGLAAQKLPLPESWPSSLTGTWQSATSELVLASKDAAWAWTAGDAEFSTLPIDLTGDTLHGICSLDSKTFYLVSDTESHSTLILQQTQGSGTMEIAGIIDDCFPAQGLCAGNSSLIFIGASTDGSSPDLETVLTLYRINLNSSGNADFSSISSLVLDKAGLAGTSDYDQFHDSACHANASGTWITVGYNFLAAILGDGSLIEATMDNYPSSFTVLPSGNVAAYHSPDNILYFDSYAQVYAGNGYNYSYGSPVYCSWYNKLQIFSLSGNSIEKSTWAPPASGYYNIIVGVIPSGTVAKVITSSIIRN